MALFCLEFFFLCQKGNFLFHAFQKNLNLEHNYGLRQDCQVKHSVGNLRKHTEAVGYKSIKEEVHWQRQFMLLLFQKLVILIYS